MKKKVRKTNNVNCAILFSSNKLSSAINAQSESDKHLSPTSFERRWDMNGKQHLSFLHLYSIAVHTAFYHSYSVEASNSLTCVRGFSLQG